MEGSVPAACYIRVSTEDQTEYSPVAQRKALESYARQHGMTIDPAHVYIDAGISGRKAVTRPAFMEMIGAAKRKPPPFSVILVHKLDRFARNREDSIVYKSMLRRQCGVRVVSVTEHLEDERMGLILEAMLEAMAEYYSINLGDEVRKGMAEKARRGELQTSPPLRLPGGGEPPDPNPPGSGNGPGPPRRFDRGPLSRRLRRSLFLRLGPGEGDRHPDLPLEAGMPEKTLK